MPRATRAGWQSVEQYHQQFLDFWQRRVTLPGHQLNKNCIPMMQRRLAAGIDQSKTLAEVALEAGIGEEKIRAAESAGADSKQVSRLFDSALPNGDA